MEAKDEMFFPFTGKNNFDLKFFFTESFGMSKNIINKIKIMPIQCFFTLGKK